MSRTETSLPQPEFAEKRVEKEEEAEIGGGRNWDSFTARAPNAQTAIRKNQSGGQG